MSVDRADVLNQLAAGQLSADEAAHLLRQSSPSTRKLDFPTQGRWLRIRVAALDTGRNRATVNLPLAWVKAGLAIGAKYHADLNGVDVEEIVALLASGANGKLIDVEDYEDNERVEVFVD
jgi:hypothetical protein